MSRIWVGIDSGKGHHCGLALDAVVTARHLPPEGSPPADRVTWPDKPRLKERPSPRPRT